MLTGTTIGLLLAVGSALAAILLGRNLTRSLAAASVSVAGLALAMLIVGAGFSALFVTTTAALVLLTTQLFGWMLVDVDRDHLPATDRMTWLARILAFGLLGGGLALLAFAVLDQGLLSPLGVDVPWADPATIGALLFGSWRDLATLCGLALAGGLLATLMLLREEGGIR